MLIHELLNKYPDIVPYEAPMVLLGGKSDMCMANNGKDNKHKRLISRIMYLLRNGEKCKMHKIDWCEGNLQLAYISTKYFGDHYLTPRMKYIVVILDNWDRTLIQDGW